MATDKMEVEKKVLLIGAGGVGCEVLKNLVLCGVESITLIDLDTIEVSNLNRQFLFRREHVGMSKASVAAEAMRRVRPELDIRPIHGNVLDTSVLSLNLIRSFSCVINALDNIQARSHVNRLCMATGTPLIETGTAGYLGQASFILKGTTECYDCIPRKDERNRTYPACTIRNTPSEPAHCVIWAKFLFSQLFGEADPDAEVSPDPDDPELKEAEENSTTTAPPKINTRQWVEQIDYDAMALLNKLFHDDIGYLLRLDSLWKKRVPPTPLNFNAEDVSSGVHAVNETDVHQRDHEIWSHSKCVATFAKSVELLRNRMKEEGSLVFDKDDDLAIDFVSSAANLRCTVFGIQGLKRFTVKSIAGNIIAAIATTNSVIAGSAVVMMCLNVLLSPSDYNNQTGLYNGMQQLLLRRTPVPTGRAKNQRNSVFVVGSVQPPNPLCYVCSPSSKNSVLLEIAFDFTDKGGTLKAIREHLLLKKLNFAAPELATTEGRVLISGDDEDNDEAALNRTLSDLKISGGCIALVEDWNQNISISISFSHVSGVSFEDALESFQAAPRKAEPVKPVNEADQPLVSRKRPLEKEKDETDLTLSGIPNKRSLSENGNGYSACQNGNGNGVISLDDSDEEGQTVMKKKTLETRDSLNTEVLDSDDECIMVL